MSFFFLEIMCALCCINKIGGEAECAQELTFIQRGRNKDKEEGWRGEDLPRHVGMSEATKQTVAFTCSKAKSRLRGSNVSKIRA